MFSKLNVKKIKGTQSSFVFNFVPLFMVKPNRNITTQRVGNTCSPTSVKIIISRNQGAQGNTLNKHSLEPVFGNTQGRKQTRWTCPDAAMRQTQSHVGSGRQQRLVKTKRLTDRLVLVLLVSTVGHDTNKRQRRNISNPSTSCH